MGNHELELGIAVATDCQGRGIGRTLFEAAIVWARERHFRTIVATCYADNSRVLALLNSAPFAASVTPSIGGIVDVAIPLQAPLPEALSVYVTPDGKPLMKPASRQQRVGISRSSRAVWQRTRRLGHAAGG